MQTTVRASRRKFHIIYKTTCLVTGKWYIGMHSTDDLDDGYMGSGQQLRRSIKKYGKEQHRTEVLEFLPDRKALGERETELITKKLLEDELCMNLTVGGTGAADRPIVTKEETSRKLSEKTKAAHAAGKFAHLKGKPQSPSSIAKRVAKNTGKTRTPEQLANLKAGQQAYQASVNPEILKARGQQGAQTRIQRGTNLGGRPKGIPMSEEQKARQSAATRGKRLSDEHRLNLKKPKTRISCLFCRRETTTSHLPRYHGSCS